MLRTSGMLRSSCGRLTPGYRRRTAVRNGTYRRSVSRRDELGLQPPPPGSRLTAPLEAYGFVPGPRTRRRPQQGDTFEALWPDGTGVTGLVLAAEVTFMRVPKLQVVAVYRPGAEPLALRDVLSRKDLLIEPQIVSHIVWSRGYFRAVGSRRVDERDIRRRVVFHDHLQRLRPYFDLAGGDVQRPRRRDVVARATISGDGAIAVQAWLALHDGEPTVAPPGRSTDAG